MTETQVLRVVEEIQIAASAERIFRSLVDPDEIPLWWGEEDGYQVVEARVDLRVDGAYRLDAIDGSGTRYAVVGRYLEIDPPRRLSYTWIPSFADDHSVVTITLEPVGERTRVRVDHTRIGSREGAESFRRGWVDILGWLRDHFEAG